MNRTTPVNLARGLSWLAAIIICLVPFHAFLTVWLSSQIGHYTLLRLWKEFLLVPVVLGTLCLLTRDRVLAKKIFSLKLVWLIGAYFVVLLVCALIAAAAGSVSQKAMWYGLLVDSRFLVFFLAVLILAAKDEWLGDRWQKLLFVPAILVAAFAILQYLVLPYDFLKHFGYSQSTIYPYETLNHNIQHLRVMSTLRGANPLGAYLVVPISVLAAWTFKVSSQRRDKIMFGAGLLLALLFSFSRSAWLGAAAAILIIAGASLKSGKARRATLRVAVAVAVLAAAAGLLLRNNLSFQEAILHTDRQSAAAESSNQGHAAAFKLAVKDIRRQPLGGGVGSAGPQSVYNDRPARIAEDYYLQIGQEAGILGMGLFIAVCAALGVVLYKRRRDPLTLALFASLAGLSIVNLLSHAWADDTLAYVWWGLAGIALAPILTDKRKQKNAQKTKTPA